MIRISTRPGFGIVDASTSRCAWNLGDGAAGRRTPFASLASMDVTQAAGRQSVITFPQVALCQKLMS